LVLRLAVPAWILYLLPLTCVAFPICILIAILRYNLLDIDRLFSVTIAYSLLLVVGLALVFAGVPAVAAAASTAVGLDAQYGQIAVALLVATLVVVGQTRVRPAIDRVFFPQRYAVERGIDALLRVSIIHAGAV
jgi:hypothetical protein